MNGWAKKDGKCSASDLLDASRDEKAPLHPLFEWDDSVAAEQYRLEQARLIIRSVYVIDDDKEEQKPIRAHFHIDNNTNDYIPTVVIMQDKDMKEALFRTALSELRRFAEKYRTLKEFSGVFSELEKLEAQSKLSAERGKKK